jgi:hypothetical protein
MSQSADTAARVARTATYKSLFVLRLELCFSPMNRLLGIASVLAIVATFVPAATSFAEDSMRCGSKLVTRGDGKDKVLALCGEPTSVSLHGMVRRAPRYDYGFGYNRYEYYGPGWIDLPVEIWTYNFGSSKLLRKLRFVGDELDDIDTAGYGY